MNIILIGNYKLDQQESMERFALMLQDGFNEANINTEIWRPKIIFGTKKLNPYKGLGKYLGYFDKWLLFPVILKIKSLKSQYRKETYFHICDHSNAPYLNYLPKKRSGITCHDVLAIRGALGFKDAYCPASGMGVILQKWILKNLGKATNLFAVSNFTLKQLQELTTNKNRDTRNWKVVLNAFNAPFKVLDKASCYELLQHTKLKDNKPFILHVGSPIIRKNRKLLLDMASKLGDKWNGYICFAGAGVDDELLTYAKKLDLDHRVISIVRPNHDTLVALFNACEAFIFPSFSEGFGWPLIEAQACGAPVIASSLQPMPEVSGGAAIHVSPCNPEGYAEALLNLKEETYKTTIIEKGFENVKRFSRDIMIKEYLKVYQKLNVKA